MNINTMCAWQDPDLALSLGVAENEIDNYHIWRAVEYVEEFHERIICIGALRIEDASTNVIEAAARVEIERAVSERRRTESERRTA